MIPLLLGLLAQAAPVVAAPPPAAVVAPLDAGTWGRGWVGGETAWTTGAERRALAVGWIEGQAGFGRWGRAGTAGVLGASGKLKLDDPATFSAFRAQAAVHRNLIGTSFAACGLAGAVEYGVPLETTDGQHLVHAISAGAGMICSGPGWRVYLLAGQDMQMAGFALIGYLAFPVSDRVEWVTRGSFGSDQRYVLTLDVAARFY